MRVQLEHGIARQCKALDSKGIQQFGTLQMRGRRPRRGDLGQAVRDEEDEDDEEAVCGALDFKVAEEGVGAEEVERFVYYVGGGGIGCVVGLDYEMRVCSVGQDVPARGDGPLILVLMGRIDVFPTSRTSGSSLSEEWYAYIR
jgi:hypothetical protein